MYSILYVCAYIISGHVLKCYLSGIVQSRMTKHFRPPCKCTELEKCEYP